METKRCPTCGREKGKDCFYKRSGSNSHLRRSWCIECEGLRQKNQDRERIRAGERRRYATRLKIWMEWFRSLYGEIPICQCCGVTLKWQAGNRRHGNDNVVFDHRNGGKESIKSLYGFVSDRELSEKNKNVFLSCDFGILCRKCNTMLPTQDRDKWLKGALNYVNRSS